MSDYGAKELASAFRTVRGNTLEIAKDIPENKYDFVAAPGTKSSSELLRHIAYGPLFFDDVHRVRRITTFKGYDFGAIQQRTAAKEREPLDKAGIVALLETEGARFVAWLESLSEEFLNEKYTDPSGQNPKTRFESLLGAKEHEMHHRGQLMLIERMIGVVPHLTRQREERIRARPPAAPVAAANAAVT